MERESVALIQTDSRGRRTKRDAPGRTKIANAITMFSLGTRTKHYIEMSRVKCYMVHIAYS